MHSLSWTSRVITRALRNGFSTLLESATAATTSLVGSSVDASPQPHPHFISAVCGFPKDFLASKHKPGKYGEDSWFKTSTNCADVIGKIKC